MIFVSNQYLYSKHIHLELDSRDEGMSGEMPKDPSRCSEGLGGLK